MGSSENVLNQSSKDVFAKPFLQDASLLNTVSPLGIQPTPSNPLMPSSSVATTPTTTPLALTSTAQPSAFSTSPLTSQTAATVPLTQTPGTDPLTGTRTATTAIAAPATPALPTFSIMAEGNVNVNGNSTFDGVTTDPNDDAFIYAGKGFTFNGNTSLPVQRDGAGNPIRDAQGRAILRTDAVAVSSAYTTSNVSGGNRYAGLQPPAIVPTQTVTVPAYTDTKQQELTCRIPSGTATVTFNAQTTPLNTASDWAKKFPVGGTAARPTVVQVINGGLTIPAGVNLSNTIILVDRGAINFNGNGHSFNNVVLVANAGNINLGDVQSTDLSALASGTINMNGSARFSGTTLLATGSGDINFDGATKTIYATQKLSAIAQGNITYNGASDTRGTFLATQNFTFNGNSSLVGSIKVKGNITFNGKSNVIGVATDTTPPTLAANLSHDTAPGNTTNSDRITSDPTITGSATDNTAVATLRGGLNATQSANFIDVQRQADGSFSLNRTQLAQMNGGTLADGAYTLHLQATDPAGNTAITDVSFVLDTTTPAPVLTLDSASDLGTSNSDRITKINTPKINDTAEAGATVQILDGTQAIGQVTANAQGTWSFTTPVLSNGNHSLSAIATDIAGNVSTASAPLTIVVDAVQPILSLTTSTTTPITQATKLSGSVDGTGSAISSATYSFDGGTARSITLDTTGRFEQVFDLTGVANGNRVLTIITTDIAGNVRTAQLNVVVAVDKEAPIIAAKLMRDTAPDNQTNQDVITFDPTISGTVRDANGIVEFQARFSDTAPWINILAQRQADGSFALTRSQLNLIYGSTVPDGTYTLQLQAKDEFGNTSDFGLGLTLDTIVLAPINLQLTASSDTGVSSSDRVTRISTPTITGSTESNARVQLFEGSTLIGQTTATLQGGWQITTTALTNGEHTLTAVATDIAGNVSSPSTSLTLIVDTIQPQLFLTLPLDAPLKNDARLTGTISGTGSEIVQLSYRFDTGSDVPVAVSTTGAFNQTLDLSRVANGQRTLTISATDVAGNVMTQQYTVTVAVDRDAPTISVQLKRDTAPGNATNTDRITFDPTIVGTVNDANRVVAFRAGFENTSAARFVDVTAQRQADGGFAFDRTQLNAIYGAVLPDGVHTLSLQAQDEFGNFSEIVQLRFTLDTLTETPSLDLDSRSDSGISNRDRITQLNTPLLVGSAEPNARVQLFEGTQLVGETTADANGRWQTTAPPLSNGVHTFSATSTDIAGNVSQPSSTITIVVDALQPVLNLATPIGTSINQVSRLTGSIDGTGSAISSATYRFNSGSEQPIVLDAAGRFDQAFNLSGIANGNQLLTITTTDVAGNVQISQFNLVVAIDKEAPLIAAKLVRDTAPDNQTNQDVITFDPTISGTVRDANAVVEFQARFSNTAPWINILAQRQADGSFTLTRSQLNLIYGASIPDGTYTLQLQAKDEFGNASLFGLNFILDTIVNAPTNLQLTINIDTGVSASDRITQIATPTITGSAEPNARVQLFESTALVGQTTATAQGTWQITTTALSDGVHTLNAIATDIAGNVSVPSQAFSVMIDTLPPELTLAQAPDSAPLKNGAHLSGTTNGTGSDIVQLQYRWNNGQLLPIIIDQAGKFDQAINFTGIGNSAQTLAITATDTAGNAITNTFQVTVALDLDAPVIAAALLRDTAPNATTNSDQITSDPTISGTIKDASGIASVKVGFDSTSPAQFVDLPVAISPDGSFTLDRAHLEQIYGGTLPDGTHSLYIVAQDPYGNTSSPTTVTFTLDTTPITAVNLKLDAASDTGVLGDGKTTAQTVTLVGQTEAFATIVLTKTGAIAKADANGNFQFTQIPLELGDNALTVKAFDTADNLSTFTSFVLRETASNVVLDWNKILLQAIQIDRSAPPLAARNMAMVHAAIYDAVNAVTHSHAVYHVDAQASADTSVAAATVMAAYEVLATLYPRQKAAFDALMVNSLATIADGTAKTNGIALGQQVAAATLAWRSTDGAYDVVAYSPDSVPGHWQPTPGSTLATSYNAALLPQWRYLTPFALTSGDQFRPAAPPALSSDQYTADFNQVKALGIKNSTVRTADQTQIALFWADGGGTYTPPGHWNQIAEDAARQTGQSLEDTARLFALLNISLADAGIAAWDAKYTYDSWRPITAIQNANLDGNAATTADPTWTPLISTPPFPEYVSGHSTFSGAADAVLTDFFGNTFGFSTTSTGLPGVTRSFSSFDQAAEEAGISRIYGGIHFNSANRAGLATGRTIGQYIFNNFLGSTSHSSTIRAGLANDTAPTGTNADHVTADPTIRGQLAIAQGVRLRAGFGDTAATYQDVSSEIASDGSFILDRTRLSAIYGSALVDGTYTLYLRVEDAQGNEIGNEAVSFTLDTTAPTLTLNTTNAGEVYSNTARLIGGGTDLKGRIASARYSLDGQDFAPLSVDNRGNFNQEIQPGLATGTHQVEVEVFDLTGNVARTTTSIVVSDDFTIGGAGTQGWGSKTSDSIVLGEQNSFVVQTTQGIDLSQSQGTRTISFDLDAQFDQTDTTKATEDRFLVYLVNPYNPTQTLLDHGEPGTAVFSLSGQTAEFTPGLVSYDGHRVQIDVSSLGNYRYGTLVFQLVNQDGDSGSIVRVQHLTNTVDPAGTSSPILLTPVQHAAIGSTLSVDTFKTTLDANLVVSNVHLDAATGRYIADLQVRNTGLTTLSRQMAVVLTNLPDGVQVLNASGIHPAGSPYLNLHDAIRPGGLAAGALSDAVQIEVSDSSLLRFGLQPVFLVGPADQAPSLASLGSLTVKPGERLEIPLAGSDPTTEPVQYFLKSDQPLPTGRLTGNGTLIFTPTPDQVGTYHFTLVAKQGDLETTQDVTLNVAPDPVTTTRISGVIQDTNQAPLAGIVIELGGRQTTTAADGSFQLEFTGALPSDTLKVHGEGWTNGAPTGGPNPVLYPFIAEKLPLLLEHQVYAGVNNVISRPIFLPLLDTSNLHQINPQVDEVVTSTKLPGSQVTIAANTLFDKNNVPFTGKMSITEVPITLTPAALPSTLHPDLVVTIQPGDMVFTTSAKLSLPNRSGYVPGTLMDLWSINPNTGAFDKVGVGEVSADGSVINTISGGIRNSSWHFFVPQITFGDPFVDPSNLNCPTCRASSPVNSEVDLYSGTVTESHNLVTYQAGGMTHGLSLHYDSRRADPQPIIQFGYNHIETVQVNVGPSVSNGAPVPQTLPILLTGKLEIQQGNFTYEVSGIQSGQYSGLTNGDHAWNLPYNQTGAAVAGLQADLEAQGSGKFTYNLTLGVGGYGSTGFTGSSIVKTGTFVNINSTQSAFGSGWGIAGLQELVTNQDGSVLLIDGNGGQVLFDAPTTPGGAYISPDAEISTGASTLERLADGTFRRTMKDQTVYQFNLQNKLASVRDPNGMETRYAYDTNGDLMSMTDPTGLVTTLGYTNGKATSITDPSGRVTTMVYDDKGNLTQITDPDGTHQKWGYDQNHNIVRVEDKAGNVGEDHYNAAGRLTDAIRKDGSIVQLNAIETQGLPTSAANLNPTTAPNVTLRSGNPTATYVDGNGHIIQTQVDSRGQTISGKDGTGFLPSVKRDAHNLITEQTDARGYTTVYTYDSKGNVLTVKDSLSQGTSTSSKSGSLFSNRIHGAGFNPHQVITSDLNGDGNLDIITAESTDGSRNSTDSISILLGDGQGRYAAPQSFAVDSHTIAIALGDLNEDGKADLIAAEDAGEVSVFNGDGQGHFNLSTTRSTNHSTMSLALGDLDGDGHLDLLLGGGYGDAGITVLSGSGTGDFTAQTDYASQNDIVNGLAVADVNGDGRLDVITSETDGQNLVHLNDGYGGLTSGGIYQTGNLVGLSDVNGDGRLDLVANSESSGKVSVALGNGDGTFSTPIATSVDNTLTELVLKDANGDGKVDLVGVNTSQNSVSIVYGDGTGGFGKTTSYQVGYLPTAVTFADTNHDGKVDLIAADSNNNGVSVLLNNGVGGYLADPASNQVDYPVGQNLTSAVLADINGDNIADLITTDPRSRQVFVSLGKVDGTFRDADGYYVADSVSQAVVGDVNGDGLLDLILNGTSGTGEILLNRGDSTFAAPTYYSLNSSARTISVGDINGDGKLDIVGAGYFGFSLALGNGDGTFTVSNFYDLGNDATNAIALKDLNGDGALDVVLLNADKTTNAGKVAVWLNDGTGAFTASTSIQTDTHPDSLTLSDINGDGKSDLITANSDDNSISVFLGTETGSFNAKTDYQVGRKPTSLAVGDVNGDGKLDVLVTNRTDSTVSVLFGDGQGGIVPSSRADYAVDLLPTAIALGDLNFDGQLDFVTANSGNGNVSVRLNNRSPFETVVGTGERRYTYDSKFNKLTSVTDELGRTTLYQRDSQGRVKTETRIINGLDTAAQLASGTGDDITIQYTYTDDGRLRTKTDALGHITEYDYTVDSVLNPTGNLRRVTSAKGTADEATQYFEYDSAGNRTAFVEEGHRTEYRYDSRNNQLLQIIGADPDGATGALTSPITSYTYWADGHLKTVTDPLGNVTSYFYNVMGQLERVVEADDKNPINSHRPLTQYHYDKVGNLVSITDPLNRTTTYTYDSRNRRTATENADHQIFKENYDADNHLISSRDPKQQQTTSFYDARGRLIRSIDALGNTTLYSYDVADQLIATRDANGNLTRYLYDDAGRQIAILDAQNHRTQFEYDKVGNLTAETDALGHCTEYRYDNRNRRVETFTSTNTLDANGQPIPEANRHASITKYDKVGNVVAVVDELGKRTEYEYDNLNRRIREIDAENVGKTGVDRKFTETKYDADNNVIAVIDKLGNQTTYAYDGQNRQIQETNAQGEVRKYEYDQVGNRTAVIDELGNRTKYEYDSQNRQIREIDAENVGKTGVDRKFTETKYDEVGNVVAVIDPNLNKTTYEYDALNRLTSETNALGLSRTYTYDRVGNQTSVTDHNHHTRVFEYDSLNHLKAEKWLSSDNTVIRTISSSYDDIGELKSITDPDSAYTFTYDANGHLSSVDNTGTLGVPSVQMSYSYDVSGNLLTATDRFNGQNQGVLDYSYDALNRVRQLTQHGNGVQSKYVEMTYSAVGQVATVQRYSDLTNTAANLVAATSYAYDSLNRLQDMQTVLKGGGQQNYHYGYDAANRITQIVDPDGINNYDYTKTDQLQTASRTNESYTYDANGNRANSGYQTLDDNRLQSDGVYHYLYDNEGNLIQRVEIATGQVRTFTWDYRNRLTQVTDQDATGALEQQVFYTYDALNQRISKTTLPNGTALANAATTYYIYDRGNVALEFTDPDGRAGTLAPQLTARYLYGMGIDHILAQEVNGNTTWMLSDHLGSVRDLVDSNGMVLNHYVYDSFGKLISSTANATADTRYRYTGREWDSETQQYYYRSRYYDANTGRFISQDPNGFNAGDPNLYRYVGNSPTSFTDPTGLNALPLPLPQISLPSAAGVLQGIAEFGGAVLRGGLGAGVGFTIWNHTDPLTDGNAEEQAIRRANGQIYDQPIGVKPQLLPKPVRNSPQPTSDESTEEEPEVPKAPPDLDCEDDDGIVPIYKAPQIGMADRLYLVGFSYEDFAGNGFNYFAKEKFLADDYASRKGGYDGRVLEVDIPKKIYDSRFIFYEKRHNGKPTEIELEVPAIEIPTLNSSMRFLSGRQHGA